MVPKHSMYRTENLFGESSPEDDGNLIVFQSVEVVNSAINNLMIIFE